MNIALPPQPEFGQPLPIEGAAPEVLRFLALRRSASAGALRAPAPSPAELDQLLRLATRVPDHGKLFPWRFILLEGEAKAKLVERLEAHERGASPIPRRPRARCSSSGPRPSPSPSSRG